MAVSNNLTAILNFVAMMCSFPIIAAGIWLASRADNACLLWLRWPLVSLGLAFLLVSAAGFVGAYWKKEGLLAVYLVAMFTLIVLLLVLLVVAFVVTRPDGSYSAAAGGGGVGFKEYRLGGFSPWLRDRVVGNENWGKIRACLAASQICPKLNREFVSAADFFAAHLSPLQSGCCKPPLACGFQYSDPTMWLGTPSNVGPTDCTLWSNDPSQLCYNCDSCKAGLLGNLREEWRKTNVILIITVVLLIWVYLIACSAYRNAQTEQLFRRYKQGWI